MHIFGSQMMEASLYDKIMDQQRLEPEFFRVGFYGKKFPFFLRVKKSPYSFCVMNIKCERITLSPSPAGRINFPYIRLLQCEVTFRNSYSVPLNDVTGPCPWWSLQLRLQLQGAATRCQANPTLSSLPPHPSPAE